MARKGKNSYAKNQERNDPTRPQRESPGSPGVIFCEGLCLPVLFLSDSLAWSFWCDARMPPPARYSEPHETCIILHPHPRQTSRESMASSTHKYPNVQLPRRLLAFSYMLLLAARIYGIRISPSPSPHAPHIPDRLESLPPINRFNLYVRNSYSPLSVLGHFTTFQMFCGCGW
jgi:hypothetical protein